MSGKGQRRLSARHGFSFGRIAACVAVCAVSFCAVLTGVGYGFGWFADDAQSFSDTSAEWVESVEQNTDENETVDETLSQDMDAAVEEAEADSDDQGDRADEVAPNPDSEIVVSEEEMLADTDDANIAFDEASGNESLSAGDQNSDQSVPSTSNESTSQKRSDTSGQTTNNSSSSNTGNGGSSGTTGGSQKNDAAGAVQTITVSVYIDSSRAEPYGYPSCLGDMTVSVEQGSSVLDALKATGLAIGATNSGYVSSISGLAERACGSASGWLYYVNGVSPGGSCAKYILTGGEKIEWIYTCNMGNDV